MMYCERCRLDYPEGKKFCRLCGEPLKPRAAASPGKAARCPSCGATISPGIRFCGSCGASLVGRKTHPSEPVRTSVLGTARQVKEVSLEEEIRQRRKKILKGVGMGSGVVVLLAVVIIGGLFAYRTYVTLPSPPSEETPDQPPSEEPVPKGPAGKAPGEGEIKTPPPPSQPGTEKESGQEYVRHMVSYAMVEGGVGSEERILEAKSRIEGLPRPSPGDRGRAREANEKGLAYLKNGQIAEAVAAFQEAYQVDQADVEVVNNLGYAYMLSGDLNSAERCLLSALVLSPGRSVAWGNLGQTYAKKEVSGAAVACFANAYRFSDDRNQTCQFLQDLQEKENDTRVREAAKQTLQLKFVKCEKPKLQPSVAARIESQLRREGIYGVKARQVSGSVVRLTGEVRSQKELRKVRAIAKKEMEGTAVATAEYEIDVVKPGRAGR